MTAGNPTERCGAKTRTGKRCHAYPMHGSARCRLHGGATPKGVESPNFVHGRYSAYASQSIQQKVAAFSDDDPLDIVPELQVQRALFADYLSRFQVGVPLAANDIALLIDWSAEISRMVERIVKMRNETALTAAEVKFLAARIADVVAKYVQDDETRRAFVRELLGATGTVRQFTGGH